MLRRLMTAMALLGLACAAVFAYLFLDRPLRVVEVLGELAPGEVREVRAVISQRLPARLLSVDIKELRAGIIDLSWPRRISIRRVWPDRLSVHIERETTVAQWADEGYLSSAGEVVNTPDATAAVPYLDCAVSNPKEALGVLRYLQGILDAKELRREGPVSGFLEVGESLGPASVQPAEDDRLLIASLTENALGEWRVELVNGVQALLGAEDLHDRMHRFLLLYRHLLRSSEKQLLYLDMRYANGAAVRWADLDMLAER